MFSGTSPDNTSSSSSSCRATSTPTTSRPRRHPELRSRPTRPHPLFTGLVGAAIERQKELQFPIDESGCAASRSTSTT